MSFRSATRIARLAASAAPRSAVNVLISRRAASTSAKPKSDAPWMIGSAAVFGSLGVFLLTSGSKAHESAHGDNHDRSEQSESHSPTAKPGQDPVQNGGANTSTVTEDDPKKIHKDLEKYPGTVPSKRHEAKSTGYPHENVDDSGSSLGSNRFSSDKPSGSESDSESKSETPENVDDSGVSLSDVKDSVVKAAKSNVPEIAWNSEKKSSDSTPSGSDDTPSNVDDSNAPSAGEIKDSVRQAAKSNAPEVAWDDEKK